MGARAFLGLGTNLGDRLANLQRAVDLLAATSGIRVVRSSRVYETAPVGPPQPDFLNAVIEVDTDLEPHDLLAAAAAVERALHRVRDVRWGPRTIDVDVLTYDDQMIDTPDLTVPHPRMHERGFVARPTDGPRARPAPAGWPARPRPLHGGLVGRRPARRAAAAGGLTCPRDVLPVRLGGRDRRDGLPPVRHGSPPAATGRPARRRPVPRSPPPVRGPRRPVRRAEPSCPRGTPGRARPGHDAHRRPFATFVALAVVVTAGVWWFLRAHEVPRGGGRRDAASQRPARLHRRRGRDAAPVDLGSPRRDGGRGSRARRRGRAARERAGRARRLARRHHAQRVWPAGCLDPADADRRRAPRHLVTADLVAWGPNGASVVAADVGQRDERLLTRT